ncbi:hypothetical protein HNQ94_000881 [Salirhabdus euzebyi]|uniref:Uncharacterized protein n=1 Tax=Salirhabdus euzebyi TaxID=394506 RepID=A0A841PY02_9BACI|nr:CBO0543 family protein [Salirhabdus euzebyi]MBB6452436.1 hypothetical protein [Salirhabdus euzebyi]
MTINQQEDIQIIKDLQSDLMNAWMEYWNAYSDFNTWQFWVIVGFLLIPLVLIILFLNREKAFFLGFYGFNVHVWFTYADTIGGSFNAWFYPYKVFPFLSTSFALDVSLVPMAFMFTYQWVLKYKKNYYIAATVMAAFLSFVFKPILVAMNLFQIGEGVTYYHLFVFYLLIAFVSKWITNIFSGFEQSEIRKNKQN